MKKTAKIFGCAQQLAAVQKRKKRDLRSLKG
jgi:hypothetical protein